MNYRWNWNIFFDLSPDAQGTYLDMLLAGARWTVATALISFALALLIGTIIGVMRTLPSPWARGVAQVHVEILRNVPLLVQMFLWYFVLPELLPKAWGAWLKQLPNAPFVTAVVCLGFFTSARIAEQVRAGLGALPRGQTQAAIALGLTRTQTYTNVLMPQAYRILLPTLTSEFLNNLKNTSVGLTIGLVELTAAARAMQEFSFQVFEAFSAATLIYLAINLVATALARLLEHRYPPPSALRAAH